MKRNLLQLVEDLTGQEMRIEATTVFGSATSLYAYPKDPGRTFGEATLSRLKRLDWVKITCEQNRVSRTHGLLDPTGPRVRDLNSLNGILLNGRPIPAPSGEEREGRPVPIGHNDVLTIGTLRFRVQHEQVGQRTLCDGLFANRYAVVAPADDPQTAELEAFLSQRKSFATRRVTGWSQLAMTLDEHRELLALGTGLLVVGLVGQVRGDELTLGGEARPLRVLLDLLADLGGSHVVALRPLGDPAGIERAFAEQARHHTVLLTSTVPMGAQSVEISVEDDIMSAPVKLVAQGRPDFHTLIDGLDASIPADSNVLDLAWREGYQGALSLTFGSRSLEVPAMEIGSAYMASIRYQEEGTFRTHHVASSIPRRSDPQ